MRKVFYLTATLLLLFSFSLAACGGDTGRQRLDGESDSGAAAQAASDQAAQGDAQAGQEKFTSTCSACHGVAGEGVQGLGKDMTTSEFIAGKTDAELVEFIKIGRDPSDPLNTTGVAMPPKGGNPALGEQDLFDIVAYIRTIHE